MTEPFLRVLRGVWCLVVACLVCCLASGCASVDRMYRGTVRLVDPDKMTLRGDVKWMSPLPNLREVEEGRKVVYLRTTNSSGSPVGSLYEKIAAGFGLAGYRVTRNVGEAHFTVNADVRYFGESSEKGGEGSMLTGAAVGGATGAVIGHNVGSGHRGAGAGIGVLAGLAVGNVLASRNKMISMELAVDVRIGERVEAGVKTVRRARDATGVNHVDVAGAEGGMSEGGSSEEQRVEVEEDFFYHKNRLAAHVAKMALTPDEALPWLSERLATSLSSVLP